MSKAIIRPRITPRSTALAPLMLFSPSVRRAISHAIGLPKTTSIRTPAIDGGEQRDDQHRHQAAGPGRHLALGDPVGDHTGEDTADDRAEEAGLRGPELHDVGGQAAHDEAGREAGPVGDREGDVARERRDEEGERGLAEDEEDRPDVGEEAGVEQRVLEAVVGRVGQVRDRVLGQDVLERADDLVAAEQERQGDQQAAGRHERDHVRDTGHQHPTGVRPQDSPPPPPPVLAAAPAPPPAAPSTRGAPGSSA